ncbi:MAG: type II toxin-antitoxin system RelE/ParE family toxin [Planctomycetia bacterium]|nr:type II toxin-antitoxin system RelE/ParE family toxin [Planctomycetia bacterium]
MSHVVRTAAAEHSLDEIFDTIGRQGQNPEAAARLLRRIAAKCELYAAQPLSGESRPDLGSDVRCFPVGSYVVFYRPFDSGILLLLVVHGARDIPTVFREVFRPSNRGG